MAIEWVNPAVQHLSPSGIRTLFDLCEGSPDTIRLGVGEPDFVTPQHVRDACIRALNEGNTAYTPNAGLMELREEIAHYLRTRFQLGYDPANEILVTVGSSEALDLALRTFISPGDEILIPSPNYIAYAPLTQLHGGKVVEVATGAERHFKLTAEALRAQITARSKVLMINYPNNPTGAVMTREDWLPVIQVIKQHDLIVITDEIYAELTYDQQHVSIASLPGMSERTIVISGFSKAFAMTGWRVGYVCGQAELISNMLKIHQYTAMCAPVLGQIAAIESLRNGIEEMEQMKASYKKRRALFVNGLREMGLSCHKPQGTFYAFASIAHTGFTSEEFALRLMSAAKVAVVPGHVFGNGGEGYIRCSFATSVLQLEKALERMNQFMKMDMTSYDR